jgi:hypothetical protein
MARRNDNPQARLDQDLAELKLLEIAKEPFGNNLIILTFGLA